MNNKKAVIYVALCYFKSFSTILVDVYITTVMKIKGTPSSINCLQCKSTTFMVFSLYFAYVIKILPIASCSSMSDTVNTDFLHGLITSFKISSSCKG